MIWAQRDMTHAEVFKSCGGTVAVYTARAPGKPTASEDVVALIPVGRAACVLVVADGVGGLPTGEQASRLAVDTLCDRLSTAARESATSMQQAILDGIDEANRALLARGTGAATTLAVVELQGGTVRSYHIGDSIILVTGQRGKIKLQTMAHSPVGYAVEAGLLDELEAVHHEHRHVVSNLVGVEDMRIEIGPNLHLARCDTVLIASDGLADNLYIDEIVERVRSGPLTNAARRIIEDSRRRMQGEGRSRPGHADDLSFILLRPLSSHGRGGA